MKENSHIQWEPLSLKHAAGVIKIFNYYIETATSAFPPEVLPESYCEKILDRTEGYPAYALVDTAEGNRVAGFCFLASYSPLPTFRAAANITYFMAKEYTKRGLGKLCLDKLEEEARRRGISHLIADISSENTESIRFHEKNGFELAGELKGIGEKLNRTFGVVYMQKQL